jgi:hypothetical protein
MFNYFTLVVVLSIYSALYHNYNYDSIALCQNLFICLAIPLSSIFDRAFFIVIFVALIANIYVDLKNKCTN